jgi:cell division septation protein DedD
VNRRRHPCGRRTGPPPALASALGAVLVAIAATAPAFAPAAAQTAPLDQIESLVAAHEYDAARAALDRWWSSRENARVTGADRARALMIRARLAPEPAAAEEDYLSIVLGYPLSPHAPLALLRLGQGLLAVDEPLRAAGYLRRLVADYPGRPERIQGLLWLARAQYAARQDAGACETAREGLREGRDPDLADLFRIEESTACGRVAAGATRPATERPAAPAPVRTPEQPAPAAPERAPAPAPVRTPAPAPAAAATTTASGRFAVQTGAYRQQESVDAAVASLRRAGYDPRVVLVPANALIRVRVGRFGTPQEAERLMAQLKRDRFDAVVVADADRETRP